MNKDIINKHKQSGVSDSSMVTQNFRRTHILHHGDCRQLCHFALSYVPVTCSEEEEEISRIHGFHTSFSKVSFLLNLTGVFLSSHEINLVTHHLDCLQGISSCPERGHKSYHSLLTTESQWHVQTMQHQRWWILNEINLILHLHWLIFLCKHSGQLMTVYIMHKKDISTFLYCYPHCCCSLSLYLL